MRRLKIEVKVQQGLPLDMVHLCQKNFCPRDEDIIKKYTTTSYLIYIARNSMYVKIQIHVVYEIYGNAST
jgi:hypothetical protein